MEHELIKEFVEFLEIFSEATTYMQGQKYATISCIIYFHENIMSKFINQEAKSSFGIMINLYIFAKQHFSERFKILRVHLIASLLDPCQKNWSTLNKYVKKIPSQNVPDTFVLENEFENHLSKFIIYYIGKLKTNILELTFMKNRQKKRYEYIFYSSCLVQF